MLHANSHSFLQLSSPVDSISYCFSAQCVYVPTCQRYCWKAKSVCQISDETCIVFWILLLIPAPCLPICVWLWRKVVSAALQLVSYVGLTSDLSCSPFLVCPRAPCFTPTGTNSLTRDVGGLGWNRGQCRVLSSLAFPVFLNCFWALNVVKPTHVYYGRLRDWICCRILFQKYSGISCLCDPSFIRNLSCSHTRISVSG